MNRYRDDLNGKTVLITGAGRGIGAGIAKRFHVSGARICINALTDRYAGPLVAALRADGTDVHATLGDVTTAEGARAVVGEAADRLNGIDILINNLGDAVLRPFVADPNTNTPGITDAEVETALAINLTAAIHCARAAAPAMLERRWGRVINVSAATGYLRGYPGLAAYAAAKAGLVGLTRSLACEWAAKGVTVNAIAPGMFPDRENMSEEEFRRIEQMMAGSIPVGRLGDPEEVGELAVYLASAAADYITGQTIAIDGGYSV
jgi:3-oxoacyl-[acyl-carrier protein] reductase